MANDPDSVTAIVARVRSPSFPAFRLRKGEEGISVFDPNSVEPPLTEEEILETFRPGSVVVQRLSSSIEEHGMQIVRTEGADTLPPRLRVAHREIRRGEEMSRDQFKRALKELE